MDELLELGSKALRIAALITDAKDCILNNEALFKTLKKAADRYIGGDTLEETVGKVISENQKGFKCSIATHHHKIHQETKTLIEKYKPNQSSYEFESLYGIQTENLATLREEGHPTKLYFVYGKEWYLYLCNRIAEYPLNIFRALDDIVSL